MKAVSTTKISGKFSEIIRPLIPPGIYPVTIKEWKVNEIIFGRPKLIILCEVLYDGRMLELAHFCNVDLDENKNIQSPGRRSNLYKLVRALCPNTKHHDLDNLIGINCYGVVATSTLDDRKQLKPVSEHYSKINALHLEMPTANEKFELESELETANV